MNSTRVEEVAALRALKKLDRKAEEDAALAKAEAEMAAHKANMARIAKKMANIEAEKNNGLEDEVSDLSNLAVPEIVKPVLELVPQNPKPVVNKKPAAKKAAKKAAATKPNTIDRPKGLKRKK